MKYLWSNISTLNLIFKRFLHHPESKNRDNFILGQLSPSFPHFHLLQADPSEVEVGRRANQNKLQSLPNFVVQTLELIQWTTSGRIWKVPYQCMYTCKLHCNNKNISQFLIRCKILGRFFKFVCKVWEIVWVDFA